MFVNGNWQTFNIIINIIPLSKGFPFRQVQCKNVAHCCIAPCIVKKYTNIIKFFSIAIYCFSSVITLIIVHSTSGCTFLFAIFPFYLHLSWVIKISWCPCDSKCSNCGSRTGFIAVILPVTTYRYNLECPNVKWKTFIVHRWSSYV